MRRHAPWELGERPPRLSPLALATWVELATGAPSEPREPPEPLARPRPDARQPARAYWCRSKGPAELVPVFPAGVPRPAWVWAQPAEPLDRPPPAVAVPGERAVWLGVAAPPQSFVPMP